MNIAKIALIPAYMPTEALLGMLDELEASGFESIVINDGSGNVFDEFFEKVQQKAVVISHPENLGKGVALKTGLTYIAGHYITPYVVITLDADGQHLVSDAQKVYDAVCGCPDALVLGSREFTGNIPLKSKLGNNITKVVYRLATGVRVSDTQTGLRGFSDRLIKRLLQIQGERYEYETNMLMSLARDGVRIVEVPIQTIYIDGNSSSHFDPIGDSVRIYKEILKFSASSLAGFFADYLLFVVFDLISGSVVLSNVSARVFSSALNFTLNRRFVFKSEKKLLSSALQYFALAVFILIVNTALISVLTVNIGINKYAAKIIVECVMFLFSFTVQRALVFCKKEKNNHA